MSSEPARAPTNWKPGDEVEVVASRLRLRSLRPSDIGETEPPKWYGDALRREHLWSPPMHPVPFLKGLAKACDNKNFFALLATRLDTGDGVGLTKGQVMPSEDGALFVLTTVVGESAGESTLTGFELSSALLWFACNCLEFNEISMRIYEDNVKVVRIVEHFGYELRQTYEENHGGTSRRVLDLRRNRNAWLEQYAAEFGDWRISRRAD